MATLYFTRHGRTVMNEQRMTCGNSETDLTQEGIQQAQELASVIAKKKIHIDCILYSPLSRAQKTAQIISDTISVPAKCEERLRERDFGIWENSSWDDPESKKTRGLLADDLTGGETMLKMIHRIYGLLDELTSPQNRQTVYLLVGHNGIARAVESYFHNMTNEDFLVFGIKNCELKQYEF